MMLNSRKKLKGSAKAKIHFAENTSTLQACPKVKDSSWGSMGIWWCPRWHKSNRRLNSKLFGPKFFDFQYQYQYFDNFDIDIDIDFGLWKILILILILSMEKFWYWYWFWYWINFLKNFDIDIDFENQVSENFDIDIERKFDIVPCLVRNNLLGSRKLMALHWQIYHW